MLIKVVSDIGLKNKLFLLFNLFLLGQDLYTVVRCFFIKFSS